jgi:hypothetical protein
MKHLLSSVFLLFAISLFSQSTFCKGFEDGYEVTIQYKRATPNCPVEGLDQGYNESDYVYGYRTGVARATRDLDYLNSTRAPYRSPSGGAGKVIPSGVIRLPNFAEQAYQASLNSGENYARSYNGYTGDYSGLTYILVALGLPLFWFLTIIKLN